MKQIGIILAIFWLTCASFVSLAQVPSDWRIGWYGGLNFNGPTSPFLYPDTVQNYVAISSIWDQNGKLIFFSNGIKVTDSTFNSLPNSPLFSTLSLPSQEIGSHQPNSSIIIPRPSHQNQFIIFHEDGLLTSNPGFQHVVTLYYSVIDNSLNNGLGDITSTKNIALGDSLWLGALTTVKHGNGRDWWIVSGKYKSPVFYTWLVQPDTILGPFQQNIGLSWNIGAIGTWQACFSEDGENYAITYQDIVANQRRLLLLKFDRCSGVFYDTLQINIVNADTMYTYSGLYGCAFSPTGRYLYTSSPSFMYQFDLQSTNILNSITEVGVHDHANVPFPSGFNFQKLAPDGRIYIQAGNGNYVAGAIHYPDSFGLTCQVELRYLNYFTQFGTSGINIGVFPNYPNYNLGPLIGSGCDTLTGISHFEDSLTVLNIYPNPTSNYFTATYKLPQNKSGKLELFDIVGNLVYTASLSQWSSVHRVEFNDAIADGIYICKISSGGWSDWAKVVVSNEK